LCSGFDENEVTLVMGVLNVTPDSFSDGGRYLDREMAIDRGRELFAQGADIVDVGRESTRPGAEPVPEAEERRRVVPVVAALAPHGRVSIDTRSAAVADAAIDAGATLVNDVSASLHPVVAAHPDVGWIAMHMRGDPRTMQDHPHYDDVVGEVCDYLVSRATAAVQAGIEEVWIDPGIGFGKTADHNLSLLRHLDVLVATGFPVVVGASRKRFIGALLAASDGSSEAAPVPPDDRIEGSIATAVWAMVQGARMVRVHDVRATAQAVKVVAG
jgi:dihydropteroate synthase